MEINAKLVKELRDKTGAGMMDCKRALVECDGDIETASEQLRKKGLMDAAKKSSRTTADGLIAIAVSNDAKTASIIEFNSETDFVAKNEKFQKVAADIAAVALGKTEDILESAYPGGTKSVREEINALISLVGENMTFRRAEKIDVENGVVSAYIHNAVKPGMGKIGVLVAVESDHDDKTRLDEFGRKIAMHIAATSPTYLCTKCVPQVAIDKEKNFVIEQAKEMGKPSEIAEKMADGRVTKFFEDVVLLEQAFVMDNKIKVGQAIENFGKEVGKNVKITKFVKFILGDGIEKTETNFADEVMSFVK